jgi:hypothetical protein
LEIEKKYNFFQIHTKMKKNAPTGGKGLGTALPWSCWRMIGLQMARKIKKIVKTCKMKSGLKKDMKSKSKF